MASLKSSRNSIFSITKSCKSPFSEHLVLLNSIKTLLIRMETDRICTDTNSDILDNCIFVSFQFPSLRMETDRIRTDMDGYLG